MKAVRILLVEDEPIHAELTLRALRADNLIECVTVVRDGQEALDYLFRKGRFSDAEQYPLPNLILLDLTIPKVQGREVLRRIKEDPVLRAIPVVILSSSKHPKDVEECYRLYANSYLSKSLDFEEFERTISSMKDYWFHANISLEKPA